MLRTDQTDALATAGNHGLDHHDTNVQVNTNTADIATLTSSKQATLVSGTNIKTINGSTLLGSGDLTISGGGSAITVKDEGTTLTAAPTSIDFVGAGVTATQTSNAVTVTVPDNSTTKEPTITAGTTAQYWRGDKSFQTLNQDAVPNGTTNKAYTATEQTKLAGIATGATANSSDATLLARANHTGTQSADTLTDGTTNKAFLATERTKLSGIATAATANSSDATLLARANHTGTQTASTISDFSTAADARITAQRGVSGGIASLDGGGKVPVAQLPNSIMEYQGTYNATTNSPSLVDGTGSAGDVYRVSVAGSQNFGSGSISFSVGDYAVYNGSTWEKSDTTDSVISVNGQTGAAVLTKTDVGLGNVDNTSDATKQTANDARYLQLSGGTLTGTLTGRTFVPSANNSYALGGSSFYWAAQYVTRHYFNAGADLDGTVSGIITANGDLRIASAGTNSGSVATVGGTQTLTNKTIDGSSNTLSNIAESSVTNLTSDLAAKASLTGAETLTNKRITRRVESLADAATVTPASDTNDGGKVTELSQTTAFANPTGTPTDMQQYILRIKSTTARAISFGTSYRAIGLTLPTTTVAGKLTYIAMQWEAGASKWDVLYVGQEA